MKKNKLLLIGTIVFAMTLFGCPNDNAESQSGEDSISTNKITKLQAVIDKPEVQNGTLTEIDLSKYPDITDYSATINKSITITDNKSKKVKA